MRKKIVFSKLFNMCDTYREEIWFEIYRWMVQTGWKYRQHGNGVYELLINYSTCLNCQDYWYDDGFNDYNYIAEMRSVWMRTILSDDASSIVKKWRKDNGVSFAGVRHLNLQIADEPINEQLITLFSAHRRKLTTQLNSCWDKAINIEKVLLATNGKEWVAILRYGFDGSTWSHTLTKQGEKTFANFLDETCSELARLTKNTGKFE